MVEQLLLQCLSLLGDADESADVSCYFGLCGAPEAKEFFGGDQARLLGGGGCAGGVGPCPEGI